MSSRTASASPARARCRCTIEPIACSRIPNAMLRPACEAAKTPPPSNSVFVDSTRSAAPPISVGVKRLSACITVLPASRVAICSPARTSGSASIQPARGSPRQVELPLRARRPGAPCPRRQALLPRRCVPRRRARPRRPCARARRRGRRTSRPGRSRAPPSSRRTSASPSGEPCAFAVSIALARRVRDVRARGRSATAAPPRRAPPRARRGARRGRSGRRRAGRASRTPRTACPCPRSAKLIDVEPSIVMWLSS